MFLNLLLFCLPDTFPAAIQFLAFGRQHFSRPGWAISAACCPGSWHEIKCESEKKWEIEWNWSLQIGTFSKRSPFCPRHGQNSSNSSRSKACSPNSWGKESKGHLVGAQKISGCGPGWLNTHWLPGDWSNDDLYGCYACLSCYQWSFTCSCCLNKTDSNTQQLKVYSQTVRPSSAFFGIQLWGQSYKFLGLFKRFWTWSGYIYKSTHFTNTRYWHFIDIDDLESSFGWLAMSFSLRDFKDPSHRQTCLLRTGGRSFAEKRSLWHRPGTKKACNDSTLATQYSSRRSFLQHLQYVLHQIQHTAT